VDLSGWVGVGLGATCECRCGILYVPMLGGGVYAGLVSLTSSPCSSGLLVLGGWVDLLITHCINTAKCNI